MGKMFNFIFNSMILTWIVLNLALLASSSPQNQDISRRNRKPRGTAIVFPEEFNSDTEENDDDFRGIYNNPDDRLWVLGDPDDSYNRNSHLSYDSLEDSNFISEEDYVELPDWMNVDWNELSLDKLEVLNNATDLTDLAGFFELDNENAAKLSGRPNNNQSGLESRTIGDDKKNGEVAKFAICMPMLVDLPVPKEHLPSMPSCVRVKRCSGCCNTDLLSCQPTKVEEIPLNVMKISKKKTRRGKNKNYGLLKPVMYESHLECSCQCKVQKKHCNHLLHTYNEKACACDCNNQEDQRKCEKSSSLHIWNKNSCLCVCRNVRQCGNGENFSQSTCRCEAAPRSLT